MKYYIYHTARKREGRKLENLWTVRERRPFRPWKTSSSWEFDSSKEASAFIADISTQETVIHRQMYPEKKPSKLLAVMTTDAGIFCIFVSIILAIGIKGLHSQIESEAEDEEYRVIQTRIFLEENKCFDIVQVRRLESSFELEACGKTKFLRYPSSE